MLSITIDWLALNFKEWTIEAENFMRTYARVSDTQATTPRFGYSQATMDSHGTVIMWNTDRDDMGHHVIFSGSALRNIFINSTVQPQALLRACVDAGGNISRLDLAKDCTETQIDFEAIYQSLEQGHNRGTARTYGRITGNDGGYTIYIGSRQSERFIRLYNKSAQLGITDDYWARLECECKGKVACAVALSLCKTTDWQAVFDGVVLGAVSLPLQASWQSFFTLGLLPIGLPKMEKITDREKWIETQVTPAVTKHYIDNPQSQAVLRLIEALNLIDRQRKD